MPSLHYSSLNAGQPWMNTISSASPYSSSTSLPYITTGLSSIVDNLPVFQGSQALNLPGTGVMTGDVRGGDSWVSVLLFP
jgi:hypothetical protein